MLTRILITACVLTGAAGVQALAQADSRTVWDGVYTELQAVRGKAAYKTHCSYCHHDDLLGGEDLVVIPPALVAAAFEEQFLGKSVGHMFRTVAANMPWRRKPLVPQEYADIISYLLKENGYPAGDRELPIDPAAVDGVVITAAK